MSVLYFIFFLQGFVSTPLHDVIYLTWSYFHLIFSIYLNISYADLYSLFTFASRNKICKYIINENEQLYDISML